MVERMQYAHPDRKRVSAKAREGWRYMSVKSGEPRGWYQASTWPMPRSKYMPHQGKREMGRRQYNLATQEFLQKGADA